MRYHTISADCHIDLIWLPVHFHTIGSKKPDTENMEPLQARQAFAVFITGFQLQTRAS